jgi:hypothetical protein
MAYCGGRKRQVNPRVKVKVTSICCLPSAGRLVEAFVKTGRTLQYALLSGVVFSWAHDM